MARSTGTAINGRKKRRTFRKRDFKLEYQKRVERGLSAGKSRSAARGHARAIDLPKPSPRRILANALSKDDFWSMGRGLGFGRSMALACPRAAEE